MGREVLKTAGLKVEDVQFISQGTAGRLPGLVAGQLNGVALHPEDVFLAQKEKPGVHVLVQLVDLMPKYFFNAYGAGDSQLARERTLVRDTVTALIETNRLIYTQKEKVIPIMVKATKKPQDAVSFAYDNLVKNCVWSVNTGFSKDRTEWSVENAIENGDIPAEKKPSYDRIVDIKLGEEALKAAGGSTKIQGCAD
jgi:NitT/TauT family transport system substrate-binding protein